MSLIKGTPPLVVASMGGARQTTTVCPQSNTTILTKQERHFVRRTLGREALALSRFDINMSLCAQLDEWVRWAKACGYDPRAIAALLDDLRTKYRAEGRGDICTLSGMVRGLSDEVLACYGLGRHRDGLHMALERIQKREVAA